MCVRDSDTCFLKSPPTPIMGKGKGDDNNGIGRRNTLFGPLKIVCSTCLHTRAAHPSSGFGSLLDKRVSAPATTTQCYNSFGASSEVRPPRPVSGVIRFRVFSRPPLLLLQTIF